MINVNRGEFGFDFYQPIFNLFLHLEILKNKISAPGYLIALNDSNTMVLDSYRTARFVGPSVPHIDPLKEVKAEREKIGPAGARIPLTTIEAATEALNGGDSDQNMEQFLNELDFAKSLGLELEDPIQVSKKSKAIETED